MGFTPHYPLPAKANPPKSDPFIQGLHASLSVNELRLKVRLGCEAEERRHPQYVRFNIQVQFPHLPSGCLSDDLRETVCYAEICEEVRALCQQEYRLLEKLGWTVFSTLKEKHPPGLKFRVHVVKEKPPIADLTEGSSFTLGDE